MYVVYWKRALQGYTVTVMEEDTCDICLYPSESQWIVPGTIGVDD